MIREELIRLEDLNKHFEVRSGRREKNIVRAVDHVDLTIYRGETLGLVGESGSGKTTLGRTVIRLIEPDSGRIFYRGQDITHAKMGETRRKLQMIFQNPAGFLDPSMRVKHIIGEGLAGGRSAYSKQEIEEIVKGLLWDVGLTENDAERYPGEFSGGQQQRIGIARAIAVDPEFIVCDEPVSALDVSYQSQIINLLKELQEKRGLTYLFISHDMSVVMNISDRVGVMYQGQIVELGTRDDIFLRTAHPYTKALMAAVPVADPRLSRGRVHEVPLDRGETVPEGGCRYYNKCRFARPECRKAGPGLAEIAPGHFVRCDRPQKG